MRKLPILTFTTSFGGILYLSIIWGYLIFSGKKLITIGDHFLFVLIIEFIVFLITIIGLFIAIKEEIEKGAII